MLALPADTPPIYYHGINFWMHAMAIIVFLTFGLALLLKRKSDSEILRNIKRGYGLFLTFYAATRIFFILATWFHSEPWHPNSYDFFVVWGYFSTAVGFSIIIFVIEKYLITKTRFLFTVLGVVLVALYLLSILGVFTQAVALELSWYSSPILIAVVLLLYMSLAIRSTGKLRRNAIIIIVGIFLLAAMAVLDGEGIITSAPAWFDGNELLLEIFYSIPPVIGIAGAAIFFKVTY